MEVEVGLVHMTKAQEPDGAVVLAIRGELDMAGRNTVEPALMAAITTGASVVIDLRDLAFCDSSGISLLVMASEKANAEGTVLCLRHLQPHVRRIFEITGVLGMFHVVE